MSILTAVQEVHDLAMQHNIKIGHLRLTLGQARDLYNLLPDPTHKKPTLSWFLIEEHYLWDGVHLMWDRPD